MASSASQGSGCNPNNPESGHLENNDANALPPAQAEVSPAEGPTFDSTLAERAPLRILVAEDNQLNQQLMLNFLEALGYPVTVVGNGQLVLDALESQSFDLIFMDIQMPVLDGLETSRQINARYGPQHRPRIIAITAFCLGEDRRTCLAAGMDDYLPKPIQFGQLELLLEHWYHWLQGRDDAPYSAMRPSMREPLIEMRKLTVWATLQPEQLRQMVQLFGEETAQLMADLQAAVQEGSRELALRYLHQLKGVCLALSLDGLKQWIAQLEKQVKLEGAPVLRPEIPHLHTALQRAQVELNQLLGTMPKSGAH